MKHNVTVETLLKTSQMIVELREKRKQQEKLLAEMEYVIYMKYLWLLRDPDEKFEESTSYYLKFWDRGGNHKGWLCVVRTSDKSEIRFPVFTKNLSFTGVTDMWDNGEIPERLIEIFFEREGTKERGGYPDIGNVKTYRRLRDKRLKDDEAFEKRYGKPRTPRPLMGVIRIEPSGSEVRLDSFVGNEGLPEVVHPESTESSEGQEGETVA